MVEDTDSVSRALELIDDAERLGREEYCGTKLFESALVCGRKLGHAGSHKVSVDIQGCLLLELSAELRRAMAVVEAAREAANWIEHGERGAHRDVEVALVSAVRAFDEHEAKP